MSVSALEVLFCIVSMRYDHGAGRGIVVRIPDYRGVRISGVTISTT